MNARPAALMAMAGATLAALFPLVAGAFHPGYDHARQFISELGAAGAPNADLTNWLGFLPAGVLLTLFPILAWRALPQAQLTTIALFGVGLYAVGYVSSAFLPCDAGCRPASPSTSQLLHNLFGLVGYLTAPVSLLLLAWQARSWPNGSWIALVGAVGGVAAIGGMATFSPDSAFAGVSQRLIEGAMLGWIFACGIYLWNAPRSA